MKHHELKTDPAVFDAVAAGTKTHEIRFNDRAFTIGDILVLRETKFTGYEMRAGEPLKYTGRIALREISHIQTGYGLAEDWCILSFAHQPAAHSKWTKDSVGKLATPIAEAVAKNASTVPQLTFPHIFLHLCDALIEREPTDMEQHQAEMRQVTSWPEANRAAAEIVAFSPPPMVRDALYRDYAVPAKEGGPE